MKKKLEALAIIVSGCLFGLSSCDSDNRLIVTENASDDKGTRPGPPPIDEPITSEMAAALVSQYVGLSLEDAEQLAEKQSRAFRIVKLEGVDLPRTEDYRPGRINATIEKGLVTSIEVEGYFPDKQQFISS